MASEGVGHVVDRAGRYDRPCGNCMFCMVFYDFKPVDAQGGTLGTVSGFIKSRQ